MSSYRKTWPPGFRLRAAIATLIILECLIGLQAWFAYEDRFLTVAQMQQRGIEQGLPFVWHLAMWSDIAIISPLAAYVIGRYSGRWSAGGISVSIITGVIASLFFHWLYTLPTMPGVHVENHYITRAGYGHVVYMALAIAIFTQLFLFTREVERSVLAIAATLLVVHVLIGTHMLLGMLNLISPMTWYPDQPLKSFFGWLTIAVLTAGLGWRFLREETFWRDVAALPDKFVFVKRALKFLEFWTQHNFDTTEKYLKLLDYIASFVGFGTFFAVFVAKVQVSTYAVGGISRLENWRLFIVDTALPCILILIFGSIYFFGRQSVRMELAIGPKLFPPDRTPKDWGGPKDRGVIFVTVVAFLFMFLLLTWFADNIKVASLIIFILSINDWRTRYLINDGIARYFSEPRYAPDPDGKD